MPKRKQQKGFRGFSGEPDHPRTCTLQQELLRTGPDKYELVNIVNVKRSSDGVIRGRVFMCGRYRVVERRVVVNPNLEGRIEMRGAGKVWQIVG